MLFMLHSNIYEILILTRSMAMGWEWLGDEDDELCSVLMPFRWRFLTRRNNEKCLIDLLCNCNPFWSMKLQEIHGGSLSYYENCFQPNGIAKHTRLLSDLKP